MDFTIEQTMILVPLRYIAQDYHQRHDNADEINTINNNYNITYKIPEPEENRICDVDLYIYPKGQKFKESSEQTKRFIMRYQHPTAQEPGYFNVYDPTTPEPKLIVRKEHTPTPLHDMICLTNHLKEMSEPMIQKQVSNKKKLSNFSLNHSTVQEELSTPEDEPSL